MIFPAKRVFVGARLGYHGRMVASATSVAAAATILAGQLQEHIADSATIRQP
jgi:hypothetical protein